MITAATIQGYKRFECLDVPQVTPLTVVGGANNVGKSSLLEALFLFYSSGGPSLIVNQFGWRGVAALWPDPASMWLPAFHNYYPERLIKIAIKQDDVESALTIGLKPMAETQAPISRDAEIVAQPPAVSQRLQIELMAPEKRRLTRSLVISTNAAGQAITTIETPGGEPWVTFPNVSYLNPMTRNHPMLEARVFGVIDAKNELGRVAEALRAIEPRLQSLSLITFGDVPLVHGDVGIGRKIPVAFMGDGTSKLLSIVLTMAFCENGLLLLDEVESGIHYSVMEKVWHAICEAARLYNCQVICTTHSYEFLSAATKGATTAGRRDEFTYIRLEQEESDIVAKTYTADVLDAAISRGWEVR